MEIASVVLEVPRSVYTIIIIIIIIIWFPNYKLV